MRHFIQVDSAKSCDLLGALAASVQRVEKDLGRTTANNIVMGMQHELGMLAAYTMSNEPDTSEIASTLLTLMSFGMVYLKALTEERQHNVEDGFPTTGQGGTGSGTNETR